MTSSNWRTVSKDEPCPACEKDHWCRLADDGSILCHRQTTPPSGFELGPMTGTGTIFRPVAPTARIRPTTSAKAVRTSKAKDAQPLRDFGRLVDELRSRSCGDLEPWANSLHVLGQSLARFGAFVLRRDDLEQHGFGFDGGGLPDEALAWPEFDGTGIVRGIAARTRDGRKGTASGSKRGIARPLAPPDLSRPRYCCEGASDAWSLDSLGLQAIARPNNSTRGLVESWLVEFLCHHRGPLFFVLDMKAGEKSIPLVEAVAVKLGRRIRYGFPPDDAGDCREWLEARITAGLDLRDENERTRSGLEFAAAIERRGTESGPLVESSSAPRTLAEVESRRIEWLWFPVLAIRFGTLIAGRHGSNKSTLFAWITAQVTRGRAFPGAPPTTPRVVLFIAGEDREAETLKPRLEAAGADLSRVILPPPELVRVGSIVEILAWAAQLNRLPPGSLVVVDPISSFVPPGFKDNESASVRAVLGAVEAFAEQNDWAIAFIRHPNKSNEGPARLRVAGSGAWVDTPRLSWLVAPDRDDKRRRYLVPLKLNVAPDGEGFAFDIAIHDAPGADPQPVVERIEAGVSRTADEILAANDASEDERSEFERAREWLDEALPPGASKSSREIHDAAGGEAIHSKTLTRAARDLGIDMRHSRPDVKGPWFWFRPYSRSGPRSPTVPDASENVENRTRHDENAVQSVRDNAGVACPERNGRGKRYVLGESRKFNHRSGHPDKPDSDADRPDDSDEIIDFGGES